MATEISTYRSRLGPLMSKAIADRVPLTGSFAMTHRCNLRCVHCYLGDERLVPASRAGEADTAFWLDLIEQVADAGCLNLLITGGEPLLRPDFADIYLRARHRGILVSVFTNGTLLDEEVIQPFLEHPPDLVEITLYGATEGVYDAVTGVRGSWRRCMNGIDILSQAGVRFGLKSVILKENQHEISAMRTFAHQRGVTYRVDPSLFPCNDGRTGPLEHRIPAAEAVELEMADALFRERAEVYYQRQRGTPPETRLFGCLAGRTGFHIGPAGTLHPCQMVDTPASDLRHGTFLEGWHSALRSFCEERALPDSECHRCEKRFICGMCPAQFSRESGSPHLKSDYSCRLGAERHKVLVAAKAGGGELLRNRR